MNDELWFFRSTKILDKEFVNLNDYFRLMIIFVLKILAKKIHHDSIHHYIFSHS
jgi:hypothetical protein